MTPRIRAAADIAALIERDFYFANARHHAADLRESNEKVRVQTGRIVTHVRTPYGDIPIVEFLP